MIPQCYFICDKCGSYVRPPLDISPGSPNSLVEYMDVIEVVDDTGSKSVFGSYEDVSKFVESIRARSKSTKVNVSTTSDMFEWTEVVEGKTRSRYANITTRRHEVVYELLEAIVDRGERNIIRCPRCWYKLCEFWY